MKKINMEIVMCLDCPYVYWMREPLKRWICMRTQRVVDGSKIPESCPLPDANSKEVGSNE